MTTTLITGANKGLGYETARRLIAVGHTVYLGARDPQKGQAAADRLGARFVHLDITDDASVDAAARTITELDVLVNNAGIEERTHDGGFVPTADVTADSLRTSFDTNVFGTVRVIHAFLPLLAKSSTPVMVNVSSGLGLPRVLIDPASPAHFYPGVAYPASKAALNMITVQYAKAFPDIRINAVEPGFTKTDLNHNTGTQTVEEGAEVIVRMAQIGSDGPTGGFFHSSGALDW
ncbi:short-chain dehydrogenase [Mycobacterium sp. MS1601]|uniref:SDR family NAD(P)-dependent oxidoreductase n=1 Tax=Mycobacterium sp. MS1601 TaxID=1936029 RepID=UPI00097913E7|nr:SDR family NAD(P)-dependent oxidoreductase [Mycobacterium sp. MS1601]AQA06203.1 short-chain dehydrogenase [Mycobacterium sp. MS1601]